MKKFFNIPRGEFIATAVLLALIIAVFSVYFLYDTKAAGPADLEKFKSEVERFYAFQQAADDSAKAAREAKWQNRGYGNGGGHSRHDVYSDDSIRGRRDSSRFQPYRPQYEIVKIDLNRCDTTDIMRVPTFGSKRAQKLVEYRERLGGFHSFSQLQEIYVLQNVDLELCEKYFTLSPTHIRKIHINSATYKELISHPYMDAYLTKTILAFREKNGKINNLEEFQQITHAYNDLMDKLKPYLDFE